jgi:hypothetical protein
MAGASLVREVLEAPSLEGGIPAVACLEGESPAASSLEVGSPVGACPEGESLAEALADVAALEGGNPASIEAAWLEEKAPRRRHLARWTGVHHTLDRTWSRPEWIQNRRSSPW